MSEEQQAATFLAAMTLIFILIIISNLLEILK